MLLYASFYFLRRVSGLSTGEGTLTLEIKIIYIVISIFLVLLAGLVSGLTIGLLSLDKL